MMPNNNPELGSKKEIYVYNFKFSIASMCVENVFINFSKKYLTVSFRKYDTDYLDEILMHPTIGDGVLSLYDGNGNTVVEYKLKNLEVIDNSIALDKSSSEKIHHYVEFNFSIYYLIKNGELPSS